MEESSISVTEMLEQLLHIIFDRSITVPLIFIIVLVCLGFILGIFVGTRN